jgi:hypothetical protein
MGISSSNCITSMDQVVVNNTDMMVKNNNRGSKYIQS